jgi:DNA-directed RNA polymerase alpha subunit
LSSLMNKANKEKIGTLIKELPFRKRLVLEMTMCGYGFNEIAKTLNVSRQMARQLLCEEIRRIACQICTDYNNPETHIDNIMMPTRCYNALRRLNIQTIRDITVYSERQLLRSYGMGVRCLGTVKKVLSQFGLSLG